MKKLLLIAFVSFGLLSFESRTEIIVQEDVVLVGAGANCFALYFIVRDHQISIGTHPDRAREIATEAMVQCAAIEY